MQTNLFTPEPTAAPAVPAAPSRFVRWENGSPVPVNPTHKIRDTWETGMPCYTPLCDGELMGVMLFVGTQTGGLQIKRACPKCGVDYADLVIAGLEAGL